MEQYEIVQRLKALEEEVAELRKLAHPACVINPDAVKLTPDLFGPGGKRRLVTPRLWDKAIAEFGTQSVFDRLLKDVGAPVPIKPHVQAPPRPYYEIAGMSRECVAYLCRKNPELRTLNDLVGEAADFTAAIGEPPSKVVKGEWSKARGLYNFERADRLCIAVAKTMKRIHGEEAIGRIIRWSDYQYHIPKDAREPGYDS